MVFPLAKVGAESEAVGSGLRELLGISATEVLLNEQNKSTETL
jgi:Arc/MetJ family transcription regulator